MRNILSSFNVLATIGYLTGLAFDTNIDDIHVLIIG